MLPLYQFHCIYILSIVQSFQEVYEWDLETLTLTLKTRSLNRRLKQDMPHQMTVYLEKSYKY